MWGIFVSLELNLKFNFIEHCLLQLVENIVPYYAPIGSSIYKYIPVILYAIYIFGAFYQW